MKLALTLIAGAAIASAAAYAQDEDDIFKQRLEKKLKKSFLGNAAWETDYDAALKKAAASDRIILAYFTRSYAP